jgi:hypothetical protein
MSGNPAQIVWSWHAVEMFSPQALPAADAKDHVIDFRPGDPKPWEAAPEAGPGKVPEAGPVHGESALFACTVDADGYLAPESGVVSGDRSRRQAGGPPGPGTAHRQRPVPLH